ncbi:MAG: hypothetical protein ACYDHZ_05400 [Dehalococcoidia bacterium]
MTNEELAKDLTIALIAKMTEPTPPKILEAYREMLQGLGRTEGTVTLETIENHLKRQDNQNALTKMMIFGATVVISGCAMSVSAALKLDFNPNTIWFWGVVLVILGIVIVGIAYWLLSRRRD